MLLQLVADYGDGDLAFAEVIQRLKSEMPDLEIVPTSVAPFDTLSAGFLVAQLALTEGGERIIYHNVAPRFDDRDPRPGNSGEGLLAGYTKDGVLVVGPGSGYSFSLVREGMESIHRVHCPNEGSQFRSRDFFPKAIREIREGAKLGEQTDNFPPVPEGALLYADGYGNLKTSWKNPGLKAGKRILVQIGDVHHPAWVSDGSFHVPDGEMAFAPGSSGWESSLWELFLRGGSARERFARPEVGTPVEIIDNF